jgi:hypothetical protein
MATKKWATCQNCGQGVLLPLSDYGPQGSDIEFKVWVCHNPDCGFTLRIDKGQVSAGRVGQPSPTLHRSPRPEGWIAKR